MNLLTDPKEILPWSLVKGSIGNSFISTSSDPGTFFATKTGLEPFVIIATLGLF